LHNKVFSHRQAAADFDFKTASAAHKTGIQTLGQDMAFIDQNIALPCPSRPKSLAKRWGKGVAQWIQHAGFDSHAVMANFSAVDSDSPRDSLQQSGRNFFINFVWFIVNGKAKSAWTCGTLLH
jgi:hypothetical protein